MSNICLDCGRKIDFTIPTKLLNLQINLTNKCDWKCSMCFKHTWPQENIEFEMVETLLDDLDPTTVTLEMSGGEPLLHPKFNKIIHLLNEKKFKFGIFTNGSISKNIDFKGLAQAQWIRISLLTNKNEILKKLAGHEHIQKQQFFIKNLKEYAAKNITGECVITSTNKDNLPTEEFWQIPILYYEEHNDALKTKLPNVVGERGELYIIPNFHALVDPSGEVFPDCISYSDNESYEDGKKMREEFKLGNLNNNSINEIFYSKRAEDNRKKLRYYYQSRLNLLNRTQRYAQKNRLIYEFLTGKLFL